ncbi:MAG: hypothetical protein NDI94_01525 [Candidatus Woesearchaeota archaeon]|nr:hypothetical protein [Candidatus Woesearchaeota archaeon]
MATQTEIYGDYDRYLQASSDGELPYDLMQFKHSLDWPIEGCISIGDVFNQYRMPKFSLPYYHNGVDIYSRPDADILAPEDLTFFSNAYDNERRGLIDVITASRSMPINYIFGHLAEGTESYALEFGMIIDKDKSIGKIGRFNWFPRAEYHHLLFGDLGNHLHITMVYSGEDAAMYNKPINPLLLFKDLKESE